MSLRAILWALEDAPVIDPTRKLVLIALADGAGDDGCGAMPGVALMARRSCVDPKTVRRHLQAMETDGLISRGDQTKAEKYRPDRRPIVWDLDLSQVREDDAPTNRAVPTRAPRNPRNQHGPIERGDIMSPGDGGPDGGTYETERGDIRGDIHVLQTKEDPSTKPKEHTPTPSSSTPEGLFVIDGGQIRPKKQPNYCDPLTASADAVLGAWWEQQNPKPLGRYQAHRAHVADALSKGYPPEQVTAALSAVVASGYGISPGTLTRALAGPPRSARPAHAHDGVPESQLWML